MQTSCPIFIISVLNESLDPYKCIQTWKKLKKMFYFFCITQASDPVQMYRIVINGLRKNLKYIYDSVADPADPLFHYIIIH